jgi:endonuclease/exonuclease/phosphatase family metal-dependent hydrolase
MHEAERGGAVRLECGAHELRVVAWNIERGRRLDLWRSQAAIARADLLLLSEVDKGCARSGNRHVARDLAEQLGLEYAFGPAFFEHTRGAFCERLRTIGRTNAEALHGVSILSRLPIEDAKVVTLPSFRDWSTSRERRDGGRVALIARVRHGDEPISVACTHLELYAHPEERRCQFEAILDALPGGRCVIGGDLNTTTIHTGSPGAIARLPFRLAREPSLLRSPEAHEPLFAAAEAAGFDFRSCNLLGVGTGVPPWIPIPRPIRPRVDWLFTRELETVEGTAQVYPCPRTWARLSEHEGVGVSLRLPGTPKSEVRR